MVGDFYGTGIEIWAGFGLVGITEKRKHLGQLYIVTFEAVFSNFCSQKKKEKKRKK